jgi:transcriptional regulator NrdR family protein
MSHIPCPACGHDVSRVYDSRQGLDPISKIPTIRRRRKCLKCEARYSTLEVLISDGENESRANAIKLAKQADTLENVARKLRDLASCAGKSLEMGEG